MIYRYTRRLNTKQGDNVNLRIFASSRIRFIYGFVRGWFEYGRGNSYELDDTQL
jgi:hypothetical protein